jgi:rubrerythrin
MEAKYYDDYREALELAIEREAEAEDFYEKAAEKIHEANAKSLLRRLAIEEKKHQKLLTKFSDDVKTPPEGIFMPPADLMGAQIEKEMHTPEQIFTFAIKKEEESLNFYSRLLVYFFGTGNETVFKEIFKMEANHKEQLERNMEEFVNK